MIKIKIRLSALQRAWMDEYLRVWNDRIVLLQERRSLHKQYGMRDTLVLQGNIIDVVQFAHYLGNKHCRITVLKYKVTPYPLQKK